MTEEQDEASLDALRRRLYRPEASGADLQRYLDRRPAEAEQPPGPDGAGPQRPLRRIAPAVAVGAVLLIALLAAGSIGSGAPRPRSTPLDPPVLAAIGDGQVLDVGQGSASEPAAITTAVRGTPVLGRRIEGLGNAVVPLAAAADDAEGGRAVVAVATDGDAHVRWRALLEVDRPDGSTSVFVLARGEAARPSSASTATTFVFPHRPPTGIAVSAPRGTRWALVYASTDGLDPAPR